MRKMRSPRVSLFAFQDIITSTTGILILITLILTFFLNAETVIGESDKLDELKEKLVKLDHEISQASDSIAKLKEFLSEWGGIDPKELADKIEQLKSQAARLDGEIKNLSEDQKEALELAAALNSEREKAMALAQKLNDLRQQIKDLNRKAEEAGAANILFPNLASGLVNRKLMLVVLSKGNHEVIEYGIGAPKRRNYATTFSLMTYLKTKSEPLTYQIVLMVKPSGVSAFEYLHGDALKGKPTILTKAGYKYVGWDPLDEDAVISLQRK